MRNPVADSLRSSEEASVMGVERRDEIVQRRGMDQPGMEGSVNQAKSYEISKRIVKEAYRRVKANRGAYGVDGQSLSDFEKRWKDNLYIIWNRMSSGSYFPPAVRGVEIPKKDGGKRLLGIPTVADRIAQMVVKMSLEPKVEPYFHKDSYGYRPKKSAEQALRVARKRCWRYDWVLDVDIRGFFDNLDHELLMKAVEKHTASKWERLYIKRWLKAPIEKEGGIQEERVKGTPQGGVISPLLANLFLHYAFDQWMVRENPQNPFERYADDIVIHCRTEEEAKRLKEQLSRRMAECRLELHPEKTRIIYCKDGRRTRKYPNQSFDFLEYTFRPRQARSGRGKLFISFLPAVSKGAAKEMRQTIRGWRLHRRSHMGLTEIAEEINPIVRGWINYYGQFYRSALYSTLKQVDCYLVRWAKRKYKNLRTCHRQTWHWLQGIAKREPGLFAHWQMYLRFTTGR